MICKKKHRFLSEYVTLTNAQDNINGGRHICAGCAYVEGVKDGMEGHSRKDDLSHLPYSQAGTVRHKNSKEAYNEGYSFGQNISQ